MASALFPLRSQGPPRSTLFPYTTLFRSRRGGCDYLAIARREQRRLRLVEYCQPGARGQDRKSTRLNSSHSQISYAVFCLKKKTDIAEAAPPPPAAQPAIQPTTRPAPSRS